MSPREPGFIQPNDDPPHSYREDRPSREGRVERIDQIQLVKAGRFLEMADQWFARPDMSTEREVKVMPPTRGFRPAEPAIEDFMPAVAEQSDEESFTKTVPERSILLSDAEPAYAYQFGERGAILYRKYHALVPELLNTTDSERALGGELSQLRREIREHVLSRIHNLHQARIGEAFLHGCDFTGDEVLTQTLDDLQHRDDITKFARALVARTNQSNVNLILIAAIVRHLSTPPTELKA